MLWTAGHARAEQAACTPALGEHQGPGAVQEGPGVRDKGEGLLPVQSLEVAMGMRLGGETGLSAHSPLGSQQQVPLQQLPAGPGCAVIVLVGFPAVTRRIWQSGCLFPSRSLPALTPEICDSFRSLPGSERPRFVEI